MAGITTAGARARAGFGGANRWLVLIVLCVSLLLVALDSTVLHVAVPAVTADLAPSGVQLLWIVDAYPLVCASLLILFGTLGDRIGRRRVLLIGYVLFGVASALAAFAMSPQMLIGARALLGIGGAMIMPATLSILRAVFPDRRERAVAIGVWTAVAAVGAAVGPVIGGLLIEHFWWGSVFLVNIPLLAGIVPLGRLVLPESRGTADGPWDVLGAVMAAAGVLAVVYGVKRLGAGEAPLGLATLGSLCVGAALLVLFVRRQRRRPHPLIDMTMFARPAFTTAVGCIVLAMLALVGLELIAVQYLQLVLGLSPVETGLRLLPLTLAAMAAGATGSTMLRRLGPRRMVSSGFVLTAVAVVVLVMMGRHDRPALLTAGFVLLGVGLQTTLFGAYESMLSEAPAAQAGCAAAIGETAYQLGAGMGIALLGSVMNAVYAPGVSSVKGVPAGTRSRAAGSLGEAYQAAARLGGAPGASLRSAARDAFVHGLHVTLVVSACLLLLGALAARRLPRVMDCSSPADAEDANDARDAEHANDARDAMADARVAPAAQDARDAEGAGGEGEAPRRGTRVPSPASASSDLPLPSPEPGSSGARVPDQPGEQAPSRPRRPVRLLKPQELAATAEAQQTQGSQGPSQLPCDAAGASEAAPATVPARRIPAQPAESGRTAR